MQEIPSLQKAHAEAEYIFRELFPANGFAIRSAQIKLCHEMLDTMFLNRTALCDAGTGIGKTYAYLVAGLLWQKYRPRGLPRTLTISTSSITLQDAVLKEYLPLLSRILAADGQLAKPIRAVIRKGRERYVCDQRLFMRQAAAAGSRRVSDRRKAALCSLDREIDLDKAADLSNFDRGQVCVPADCSNACFYCRACRYQLFLKKVKSEEVDIQICNHNYLLADAMHRQQGKRPLLKEYHVLIVDEAHKLSEAARQMYGEALSLDELCELCTLLKREHFTRPARQIRAAVDKLAESLKADSQQTFPKDIGGEQAFILTPARRTALETLCSLLQKTAHLDGIAHKTANELGRTTNILSLFREENAEHILYMQHDANGTITLCAADKTAPEQLARDLWQKSHPAILASGTIAAGGSFTRIRQLMGLEKNPRCKEFTAPSPFDYEKNCMLYLPSYSKEGNADRLPEQIQKLILATYGHALVLFTSYLSMSDVCHELKGQLPFAVYEAWRGTQQSIIQQFKQSKNGVLFAAGPCWEGVDFPGDMVSLLVIVQLPFPIPNPVSEAEREKYPNLHDYIQAVVVPEMQTKLQQGVGRAIRTETDTCVIAILDKRAAFGGRYHDAVRKALPPCPITDNIKDVERFIHAKKDSKYFSS